MPLDDTRLERFDGSTSTLLAVHQFIRLVESCTITTRLAHESRITLRLRGRLRTQTYVRMPDGVEHTYAAGDELEFSPDFAFSSRKEARLEDGSCAWCGAPQDWRTALKDTPRA